MNKAYRKATFLLAVQNLSQIPDDIISEVGFAGRSNAGKSSAINTITGIHSLARTSKTPGRTQQIIYFSLDNNKAIVDLPGYGYAKVPASVKNHWHNLMEGYFNKAQKLNGLVLVMDIRHPLREFDMQMLEWCDHSGIPVHILLTKADKLSKGAGNSTLHTVNKSLREIGHTASIQLFSSSKRSGIDNVAEVMNQWFSD